MENMERCLQCHSSLKKEETICWACNSPVPDKNPKTSAHARFQGFLNFMFKFCAVLTVAALLTPAPPSAEGREGAWGEASGSAGDGIP